MDPGYSGHGFRTAHTGKGCRCNTIAFKAIFKRLLHAEFRRPFVHVHCSQWVLHPNTSQWGCMPAQVNGCCRHGNLAGCFLATGSAVPRNMLQGPRPQVNRDMGVQSESISEAMIWVQSEPISRPRFTFPVRGFRCDSKRVPTAHVTKCT